MTLHRLGVTAQLFGPKQEVASQRRFAPVGQFRPMMGVISRRLRPGSHSWPPVMSGSGKMMKQVPAMVEFTEGTDGPAPASRTSEQLSSDDADLRTAISDLAGLVADHRRLPELLAEVATFAVRAIPGADGAGVTLLNVDRVDNMVAALAASAPFVAEIDEIQYVTLNEGPCITAALERRTVRSGSLGGEKMWPRFGPRVGRLGVHSALSLPLLLPDRVVGAINVYAHGKDVFDEHAAEFGELFARPAAVAVYNAQILADALALTVQLQTALSVRPVIDQAIGLIRGRTGRSAEDAFTQLRAMSQSEHRKLADVAQQMVDEAVRRARARARPEPEAQPSYRDK